MRYGNANICECDRFAPPLDPSHGGEYKGNKRISGENRVKCDMRIE
ncbi:MAG: hypothetical protein LBP62_06715 [Clostridiales bacterium]|nr:hypothetical protein [Clostridiales bacterium]